MAPSEPGGPEEIAPPDLCEGLFDVVFERASSRPSQVALADGSGRTVSWGRLGALAATIDGHPTTGPARRIAIIGDPSLELTTLIAATFLSGHELLFVERGESPAVRRRLVAELGTEAIVCAGAPPVGWSDGPPVVSAIDLEREGPVARRAPAPRTPYAYCVRTSGTTAAPKLIEISRATIGQLCTESVARYHLDQDSTLAIWAQPSYDAHYLQLVSALLSGATGVVADAALSGSGEATRAWLDAHGITHLQTTPGVLRRLASALSADGAAFPHRLACVMCFGERYPPELARDVLGHASRSGRTLRLHNEYGPSECILASWHEITDDDLRLSDLPVGTAIAGRTVSVEIPDGAVATAAEPGEIVIESPYLSRGYGASGAGPTVAFPTRGASRIFRTGDLGYLDGNGRLRLAGRRGRTVKRRGVRLNLDDLEAAFLDLPTVREAAARAVGADDEVRIWVWAWSEGTDVTEADLRRALTGVLELRYLPERIIIMDGELPRLRSGKVDYRSLPEPPAASSDPAATPVDAALAAAFSAVLGGIPVSADTHFFASGGHSLLALDLVSQVKQTFGVSLTLRDVLENPTVADFARVLASRRGPPTAPAEVPPVDDGGLTAAEKPIWTWCQLFPDDGAANIVAGFHTRAPLTDEAVRGALRSLVDDVAQLRLRYRLDDGAPTRVVAASQDPEVSVVTVRGPASGHPQPEVDRHLHVPFDPAVDQLVRAVVVRSHDDPDDVAVYLVVSHLISDGLALDLLLDELRARLAGAAPTPLPSQCQTPPDRRTDPERAARAWARVREDLRRLPVDERLRPARGTAGAPPVVWRIPQRVVRGVADERQVTRSAVLIATVAVAVGRLLDRSRVVVETPVTLRTGADLRTIGNYALDVPVVVETEPHLDQVAGTVGDALMEAMELAEHAPGFGRARPGQGAAPVGDVVVVLEDASPVTATLGGVPAPRIALPGSRPRHALTCYFRAVEGAGDISCTILGRSDGTISAALPAVLDAVAPELGPAPRRTTSGG